MSGGKTRTSKLKKALQAVNSSNINPEEKGVIKTVFKRFAEMRSILYSNGCYLCMGAQWTADPFTVKTLSGKDVQTVFNFCPNCGRMIKRK